MHLPPSPFFFLLLQLSITPSLINAAPLPQASGIAPLPDGTTTPPVASANSTAAGTPDAAQGTPDAASQGLDPATLAKLKPVVNGLINGIIKANGGSTNNLPTTGNTPTTGNLPPTGGQPPRVSLPNPNVPLSPSNARPSRGSGLPPVGSTGTGKTGPNNPVAGPTIAGPVSNKYPLSTSSNKYPLSTSNYTPTDSTGNGVGGGGSAGNDVPTGDPARAGAVGNYGTIPGIGLGGGGGPGAL